MLDAAWMSRSRRGELGGGRDRARHARGARAVTRLGRFRGRARSPAMLYAPLVMPEVITGLSLLLMFVAPTSTAASGP